MTTGHYTILGLLLFSLLFPAGALARISPRTEVSPVTVLVFKTEPCSACDDLAPVIDQLLQAVPAGKLTVQVFSNTVPASQPVFEQYHVQTVPQYVVLNDKVQVSYILK